MQAEILIVPTPASMTMLKDMAQTLAVKLVEQGISVNEEISLCPDRRRLQHAISKALDRSSLLFTLGGMGRDSQFIAKQVISEGLGLPLEHSEDSMMAIQDYASRRGIPITVDDVTLASLPANSIPLLPSRGIIPGAIISAANQHIIMLPENEEEIIPMLTRQVMPLLAKVGLSADSTHNIRTFGLSDQQVRQMLADLMGTTNPIIRTIPHSAEEIEIQVSAKGSTTREASQISAPILKTIATRLGDYAYGLDVESLEEAVVSKMQRKELTLSVAESGSSGMLIHRLSNAPAGNKVLVKALIVEDDQGKIERLGLTKKELRRGKDVSERTAVAMANAARHEGMTHLGAAITAHIPGFSQNESAVAYIAICDDQDVYVKKLLVEADSVVDHGSIVDAAVSRGLNMLRLFVDYLPESYHGSISLDEALAGKITVTDKESYQDEVPSLGGHKSRQKPRKERGSESGLKRLILIIAAAAFLFGAVYMGQYFVKSIIARGLREDLAAVYDETGITGLRSLNGDTVGFVQLEGTPMRYPVVQAGDNDWYLRRDFNEKNNNHGVPFLDFRGNPKTPSDNLVIYGHNMKDGQIFGELLNYTDLEYYKEHPIIKYEGLKGKGDYKVFAVFKTSAEPTHFHDGAVFNYPKFVDAKSEEEFDGYVGQIRVRSIINMPVDVEYGDELLTLSTCDYDVMDSRFVVVARKVRSGETSDVDMSEAAVNPNPLYPDIWYDTYGGTKPNIENWSYEPSKTPVAKPRDGPKTPPIEEDHDDTDDNDETPEPPPPVVPEQTQQPDPAVAQREEEARQAEAARVAEEQRVAAEQARIEEEKKAAEAEAAAAEEEKSGAENKAITQRDLAAQAAAEAEGHYQSVLNTSDYDDAKKHADNALVAANKSQAAADAAKAASILAETSTAEHAAVDAQNYANEAKNAAEAAFQAAQSKPEENNGLDTNFTSIDAGSVGTLRVSANRSYDPDDTLDLVTRVVQNEVGTTFHPEAVKAQAVAAYTFIKQANASGSTPSVALSATADPNIQALVSQVLGEGVYYNGSYAFTPYHATSAGATTSSRAVWGGSYPYLVSVDSSVDQNARGYESSITLSSDEVSRIISSKLGIETYGDPSQWIEIISEEDGGYVGNVSICGETRSSRGTKITGRLLREAVFGLRSASFSVSYSTGSDTFTFTTYGYGHGVGMSQTGANEYAMQGWSYKQILEHYYPGATVR